MANLSPWVTFVLGGGLVGLVGLALKLWDRYHPAAQVTYETYISQIPRKPGTTEASYNTFAEVVLRNRSRSVKVTNVSVLIAVPATAGVDIGDPDSLEPPEYVRVEGPRLKEGRPSYSEVRLHIERLAPRSYVKLKLWYDAGRGNLSVSGSADQAVLVSAENTAGGSPSETAGRVATGLAFVIVAMGLTFTASSVWQTHSSLERLRRVSAEGGVPQQQANEVAVELPTCPPDRPRLSLADGDTVRVDAAPGSERAALYVAASRDGYFELYHVLAPDRHLVRLKSPRPRLYLRAKSSNAFGDSEYSYLEVPARK